VSRSELLSDEPIGQGSRFVTVNRGKPYDSTITTHRPPDQLVYEVTGTQLDITVAFTVTPRGAAHIVGEYEFRPKGAMKLMFPMMQPAVRKDLAKQSQNFVEFCERA